MDLNAKRCLACGCDGGHFTSCAIPLRDALMMQAKAYRAEADVVEKNGRRWGPMSEIRYKAEEGAKILRRAATDLERLAV